MKCKTQQAFSLVELMAVVVIIGIFSALAIPGIMEVQDRNALTDTTAKFRSVAMKVRDIALQRQQAAVLEVMNDKSWINVLSTGSCEDTQIIQRCTTNAGAPYPHFEAGNAATGAGVAFCGGKMLALSGSTCVEDSSNVLSVTSGAGFAVCYSGAGELWVRPGVDSGTACGSTGDPDPNADWIRPCNSNAEIDVSFVDGSTSTLRDGAIVMFNRYDGVACAAPSNDLPRFVVFPTSSVPYTKLPGVGK